MKKIVLGLVGSVALASVSIAMAGGMTTASDNQVSSGSNGSGVFMSGDLGIGMVDLNKNNFVGASSYRHYGFAWAADLGYQFNRYIGLEAGYMTFGEAKATYNGLGSLTSSFGGFEADAKGTLPINQAFNLYGKVGTVDMHADRPASLSGVTVNAPHGSTWVPLVGVGAAYNVNSSVAVTLEDDYAFRTGFGVNTHMPAANDVLAGVTYRFQV